MKFRHICNAPLFRHILLAATLLLTSCTYHSLIRIATDYYRTRRKSYHAAMACRQTVSFDATTLLIK